MEDFEYTVNIHKLILKDSLMDLKRSVYASYMDDLDDILDSTKDNISDKANAFMDTIRESLDTLQKAYRNLYVRRGFSHPKYKDYGNKILQVRDLLEGSVLNIRKSLFKDRRLTKSDIRNLIRMLEPKKQKTSRVSSLKTPCEFIELL